MFADLIRKLVDPSPAPLDPPDARLALMALLVRLARTDGYYAAGEIIGIERIAMARFGLSQPEAKDLREEAERIEAEAPDTVRFTNAIKLGVPYEARVGVIEALWQVALADGARTRMR